MKLSTLLTVLLGWMALFCGWIAYWAVTEGEELDRAGSQLAYIAIAAWATFALAAGGLLGAVIVRCMRGKR